MKYYKSIIVLFILSSFLATTGFSMGEKLIGADNKEYKTYKNTSDGYSLFYPEKYQVTEIKPRQAIFWDINKGKKCAVFSIDIREGENIKFLFDIAPTHQNNLIMDGIPADIYKILNYHDGPESSGPFTALKIYKNQKNYILIFFGKKNIDDQVKKIAASFQLNK